VKAGIAACESIREIWLRCAARATRASVGAVGKGTPRLQQRARGARAARARRVRVDLTPTRFASKELGERLTLRLSDEDDPLSVRTPVLDLARVIHRLKDWISTGGVMRTKRSAKHAIVEMRLDPFDGPGRPRRNQSDNALSF
jgi:hypothetical protein